MIRKHITKPVKKWVKGKIKNVYVEYESQKQKPIDDDSSIIYYPYLKDSKTYIISKPKQAPELCELGLPIPPKNLWLGYGKNTEEYLYGKEQVEKMLEITKSSDFDFNRHLKILDFGCGAVRMIRWLKPLAETCEIWGADISAEHINWANQYLKPPFNFATTTTLPHLPFEDRYFDFIYAGSVFTHIDDLAVAWLLELRRILTPEGRLYITLQDNNSIVELDTIPVFRDSWLAKFMNESPIYTNNKTDYGVIVNGRGPASQVFYDKDMFCQSVKTIYEVLSINNSAYGFQTGYLLRRK